MICGKRSKCSITAITFWSHPNWGPDQKCADLRYRLFGKHPNGERRRVGRFMTRARGSLARGRPQLSRRGQKPIRLRLSSGKNCRAVFTKASQ
jgi:hypothetical protein